MSAENRVSVVVDSGSSMREGYPDIEALNVSVVPLEVKFYENGEWVPYLDSQLSAHDFYKKMASSSKLPQTSGAITGRAKDLYESLSENTNSIISVHITSQHSVAHESALLASQLVKETRPELLIEVIDSKYVSLGTWFLAEKAAELANEGYPLRDIKSLVLETIPKIEVFTVLSTLDNLVKGGRVPALSGMIGSLLQIKPTIGLIDGKITQLSKNRTMAKAQRDLIERVTLTDKDIAKLAILHTNNEALAEEVREEISKSYSLPIPIYEAGPVLGVHAGPGAVGIALVNK